MKKLLICVFIATGAPCRASEVSEKQLFVIPQLELKNSLSFHKSLEARMSRVKYTRYAVYGAMALGACDLARRYFSPTYPSNVSKEEFEELETKVTELAKNGDTLKAQVSGLEALKANPAIATDWIPWLIYKTKSAGQKLSDWVPNIVKMWAYSQGASIVFHQLPTFDRYIGFVPTFEWCMYKGTPFIESLGAFFNWYNELRLDQSVGFEDSAAMAKKINKKGFALCCHSFTSAVEKLLGYMNFATESLNKKDQNYFILKGRSELCTESIALHMRELIDMMNAFLAEDPLTEEILDSMMNFWHIKVLSIVDQLENFESVTLAAGFQDRNGHSSFNDIKRFLNPRAVQLKPEMAPQSGPLEAVGTEMLSQVAQYVM
jgi:hypothetical protein